MAESDNIKEVVIQVAIQATMTVMMALRDVETGSGMITVASHSTAQWDWSQRDS